MSFEITRQLARNPAVYATLRPPTSLGQSLGAVLDTPMLTERLQAAGDVQAANRGPGMGASRRVLGRGGAKANELRARMDEFNQSERVSPEQLNEQYGHLGLRFDQRMTPEAAAIMAREKRAEIIRNDVISRAPSDIGSISLRFATGLLATATDPIELSTVFIPGVGIARGASIGRSALRGAGQGAAINAALEPFYAGASAQIQLDYTLMDSLINVGFGAILGGAVTGGAAALRRRRDRLDTINERADAAEQAQTDAARPPRTEPETIRVERGEGDTITVTPGERMPMPENVERAPIQTREQALRAAIAQMANGRTVDVEAYFPKVSSVEAGRRPQSLLQFLAKRGGLRDDGGDLLAMNAEQWHLAKREPGERGARPRLVREDGQTVSEAAERAWERGFISANDERELLDAISRELGGDRVISREDAIDEMDFLRASDDMESVRDQRAAWDAARRQAREAIEATRPANPYATDKEVNALAAEMMDHRISAQQALEARADALQAVEREGAPERDFSHPEEPLPRDAEFDPFEMEEWELGQIIDGYRQAGTLSESSKADLESIADVDRATAGYADAARAAAACLAR